MLQNIYDYKDNFNDPECFEVKSQILSDIIDSNISSVDLSNNSLIN